MDNDALDSMDQFESVVVAILDWLRRLAPATIQNGVGGGDPCWRWCLGVPHNADKHVQRGPGMAARHRTDFGDGFSHCGDHACGGERTE